MQSNVGGPTAESSDTINTGPPCGSLEGHLLAHPLMLITQANAFLQSYTETTSLNTRRSHRSHMELRWSLNAY